MKTKTLIVAALLAASSGMGPAYAGKIQVNQLPEPVLKTLHAKKGPDSVKKIVRKIRHGKEVYEIEFDRWGFNPRLIVAADGTVIKDQRVRSEAIGKNRVDRATAPMGSAPGHTEHGGAQGRK